MNEGFTEYYVAEDGTEMVAMYIYNYEAGEVDYVGSMPAHWGPIGEEETG